MLASGISNQKKSSTYAAFIINKLCNQSAMLLLTYMFFIEHDFVKDNFLELFLVLGLFQFCPDSLFFFTTCMQYTALPLVVFTTLKKQRNDELKNCRGQSGSRPVCISSSWRMDRRLCGPGAVSVLQRKEKDEESC